MPIYIYGLNRGIASVKGLVSALSPFIPFVMGGLGAGDVNCWESSVLKGGIRLVDFLYMAITGGLISLGIMAKSRIFLFV